MKLNQLRYFLAVCKYGSFSNASKALFVSQPAISQAIRELESDYNIVLFDRNNNRLVITEDGKWLQLKAESLLHMAEDLSKGLAERAEKRRVVKIGVAPMAGNIYFYPKINDMRKKLPDIVPDVKESGSLEINRLMEINSIDLGYCLLDCVDLDKFAHAKLHDVELKFCVHKSHPLANRKTVNFAELANHKICMLGDDSYQNRLLKQKFADVGAKPDVLMYSSQISSIFTLLSYGNCGAFLFDGTMHMAHEDDFVTIPLEQPIMLTLGLVWNHQLHDSSHINIVRKYLINAFKKS